MSVKSDNQTYISDRCTEELYEEHAGMDENSHEDDLLAMRGIFRMGIQHNEMVGKGGYILVVSVNEDIFAELPALFPEIPGPWARVGDIMEKQNG